MKVIWMKCLRSLMGVSRTDRVSNEVERRRAEKSGEGVSK